MAFRYFSVDRLSPFRALQIPNEGKFRRPMPQTTVELTNIVKQRLIALRRPNAYIGLILLNTGCRISEPVFAKREDVLLDHEIQGLTTTAPLDTPYNRSSMSCRGLFSRECDPDGLASLN